MSLKEKDVVSYLVDHWDSLFDKPELYFMDGPIRHHSTEYRVTSLWRCDMLNYVEVPHPKDNTYTYKAPIYTEVKFNGNGRDLIHELQKAMNFVRGGNMELPREICVIADYTLDPTTIKFIKDNNIVFYQYVFDGFNLETLTIKKVN